MRGGSHFCQSPKGGGSGVFSLKRKGGPTLFWEKNPKIPQPSPPPRKNVPSLKTTKFQAILMFFMVPITTEHCRLVPSVSSSGLDLKAWLLSLCQASIKAFLVFIFALQGGPGKIFYGIIIYLILKYKNIENIDTCYCLLIYLFIYS